MIHRMSQTRVCDISHVANVAPEPVSNNTLVLMDFDPFEITNR